MMIFHDTLLQKRDIFPSNILHTYAMKMKFILTVLASLAASGLAAAATNDLTTLLQRGLFEEEANHQLDAAIVNYKEAIEHFDHERQLAATAIFRLGECYRKLGRTNEANAQYERIAREFPDQTQLAQLSHAYLPAGGGVLVASATGALALPSDEEEFLRKVKETVQSSPDLVNQQLGIAAEKGYVSAAEFLIAHGADVNRWSLQTAAEQGNEAMVQLLLSHGAAVDSQNGNTERRTALSLAVASGFMTVCRTLVEHGADANAKDKSGSTPLQVAVDVGQLSVAEFLIKNKAKVNVITANGMTPLTSAIMGGEMDMVKLLLDNHADANMETEPPNGRRTPLSFAAERDQPQIARLLLDHGADANAADLNGETALMLAIEQRNDSDQGKTDLLRVLLDHGADVNAPNKSGSTPLYMAVEYGNLSAAEFLITNKAGIDGKTLQGATPLSMAIVRNNTNMAKLLLDSHADANMESTISRRPGPGRGGGGAGGFNSVEEPLSPLLLAIEAAMGPSYAQMVQLLLDHGAKPNAIINNGQTALFAAIQRENVDAVRMLIEHGADVNFLDKQGAPPLSYLNSAPTESSRQIKDLLIKAGADPDYNRRRAIWTYGDDGTPKNEIFECPTNSINHYTLLGFLATLYEVNPNQNHLARMGNYAHGDALVLFPEFARVSIHRLEGKRAEVLHVNVAEILRAGDGSKDVTLQAGDMVEIAKQEHKVADKWYGLSAADVTALNKSLLRTVKIVSEGHTTDIDLVPLFSNKAFAESMNVTPPQAVPDLRTNLLPESLKAKKADTVVHSFLLNWVVRDANVLLNTWDLSRVRLKRGSAKMTFDLTANPAPDVWLEDGDVIEIPELGEGAPATEAK
jgi:ankyrin repeat protein